VQGFHADILGSFEEVVKLCQEVLKLATDLVFLEKRKGFA